VKITIESTDLVTTLDGVRVRVWKGITARGVACTVFVHRLSVREGHDATEFEHELAEQASPGRVVSFPDVS
jgi:hypothetical protein